MPFDKRFIIILFLALPIRNFASSYAQCYSQLTGRYINPSSTRNKKVEDCLKLLDKTSFNSKGFLTPQAQESRHILNNFAHMFNKWFLINDLKNVTVSEDYSVTKDFYDSHTSAAYFLKAMFGQQNHIKTLFQEKYELKVLREQHSGRGAYSGKSYPQCHSRKCRHTLAGKGPIIGVQAYKNDNFKNFGGGILGSQYYIASNIVENYGYRSDGLVEVPRIWSTALLNDFLCKYLPGVKNLSDLSSDLLTTKTNLHPIRKKSKCYQCHVTIDRLAGGINGVYFKRSSPSQWSSHLNVVHMDLYTSKSKNKEIWTHTPDKKFYQKGNQGHLLYQRNSGEVYSRYYDSLDDLGHIILTNEDFYQCVTQRLFMTLNSVRKLSKDDRRFIRLTSKNFSQHGSMKKVVKEIILSTKTSGSRQ